MKIFSSTTRSEWQYDSETENGTLVLKKNGVVLDYDLQNLGDDRYSLVLNNKSYLIHIKPNEDTVEIHLWGEVFHVRVEDERLRALKKLVDLNHAQSHQLEIKAPIPGLVVKILVNEGMQVKKDQGLLVLEAMKMENVIKAPHDAEVVQISAKEHASVNRGQLLVTLNAGQ